MNIQEVRNKIKESDITKRLSSDTPVFWKKVGWWSLGIGTLLAALGGSLTAVLPATAITIIVTVGGSLVALGQAFSRMTTDDPKINEKEADDVWEKRMDRLQKKIKRQKRLR